MMFLYTLLTVAALVGANMPHDVRVTVRDAEGNAPLRGATVRIGTRGAITDRSGIAMIHGVPDTCVVTTSMIGYAEHTDTVVRTTTVSNLTVLLNVRSVTGRDVVVTAGRYEQVRSETPVLVTVSDQAVFRAAQAASLAEGLSYQPGLRLENDCQNCGFTQVRLNGLQGPYTQILIDSRPIFSALNGVYGLEQIPASMIDRIEVVRGGGSVMYGAGAIAGTINVITREPLTTTISASSSTSWLAGSIPDALLSGRASWVSQDLTTGVNVFGTTRERSAYDRNADGFSELPLLRNAAGGFRMGYDMSNTDRVTAEAHWIREFRRGGNLFTLPPHEADIAEQLDHSIVGGTVGYEHLFENAARMHAYASVQGTERASYYGGTGGDPANGDQAAQYYGSTKDAIVVAGAQYSGEIASIEESPLLLTTGVESRFDHVVDQMPGYSRRIDQRTRSAGVYAQVQVAPGSALSAAVGGRLDVLGIHGTYDFDADASEVQDRTFVVLNPRLSLIASLSPAWQTRVSYASGFRGPQAFDEDLHISTLQGAARITRISPALVPERSHSVSVSIDHNNASASSAFGVTIDGFATLLQHPFVTALTADTVAGSNANIAVKTNGDAAWVAGVNGELRWAVKRAVEMSAALTVQDARYVTAQVLATGESGSAVVSPYIVKTPNIYGSVTAGLQPMESVTADISAVITGPMWAVNERTITMHRTPWFADLAIRCAWDVHLADVLEVTLAAGVVNVFDVYQRDLEVGPLRDAAYIYGPIRPRTISFTITAAWQ